MQDWIRNYVTAQKAALDSINVEAVAVLIERLRALVAERVADGRVLAWVESFLRAGGLEETQGWQPTEWGTPQGGVIPDPSGLANLSLDPLDQQMTRAGWERVRYAADFVILCRKRSQGPRGFGGGGGVGGGGGTDPASRQDAGGGRASARRL